MITRLSRVFKSVAEGQMCLSGSASSRLRSSGSIGAGVSEEAEGPGDGSAISELASEASFCLTDFELDSSLVSSSSISSSLLVRFFSF